MWYEVFGCCEDRVCNKDFLDISRMVVVVCVHFKKPKAVVLSRETGVLQ